MAGWRQFSRQRQAHKQADTGRQAVEHRYTHTHKEMDAVMQVCVQFARVYVCDQMSGFSFVCMSCNHIAIRGALPRTMARYKTIHVGTGIVYKQINVGTGIFYNDTKTLANFMASSDLILAVSLVLALVVCRCPAVTLQHTSNMQRIGPHHVRESETSLRLRGCQKVS